MLGSVDSNTGSPDLGWDTDQFPMDVKGATMVMKVSRVVIAAPTNTHVPQAQRLSHKSRPTHYYLSTESSAMAETFHDQSVAWNSRVQHKM